MMSVQERDPCPHRIFDDIGGAFAMGAIGGGVWNSVKGARNSLDCPGYRQWFFEFGDVYQLFLALHGSYIHPLTKR